MGFMGHFEPNMGQNMGFMGNMGNICSVGSLKWKSQIRKFQFLMLSFDQNI